LSLLLQTAIGCLLLLIVKALPLSAKAIKNNNKGKEKYIIIAILLAEIYN